MSSAVNKSQKRFMPKVSLGRSGGHAPVRRLSTLRTSFSVPPIVADSSGVAKHLGSEGENFNRPSKSGQLSQSTGEKPDHFQELGLNQSETDSISESAIAEFPNTPMSQGTDKQTQLYSSGKNTRLRHTEELEDTGRALDKHTLPTISPCAEADLSHSNVVTSAHQSDNSNPSDALADSFSKREPKPEAPDGFEYIWPEDLPKRRIEERRRKAAFERELINIMKHLYAQKEKTKIMESSPNLSESIALSMAQQAAENVTYNQLKQSVGVEAKQLRDARISSLGDENSKTLLDVNKFTMASLCKDIPVGDRNNTYDDYELARVNRRRNTVRIFRAKMWSRRMYEPKVEERTALKEAFQKYQNERKDRIGKPKTEKKQNFSEIEDSKSDLSAGHPQASIEIQANGDISLVGTQFDRHHNNRSNRDFTTGPKTEVDPTEQVINSYSYSNRERPDRWTAEETAKFYEAVSALGTDFNLISHLFPMRSRNQIKTKFKYEEKRNPAKLQIHMVSRRKFNIDSYSRVSNVPIQEVESIEVELEKVRQEHAERMKMEEESRQVAKAEDQKKQAGSMKNLKHEKV